MSKQRSCRGVSQEPELRSVPILIRAAKARHPVKLFGFCLMPNPFHFVLESAHRTALSQFLQWCLISHGRRYFKHYGGSGDIWQGRFKSFPIQRRTFNNGPALHIAEPGPSRIMPFTV
jgi:REP element-mobilizing transposase RayT